MMLCSKHVNNLGAKGELGITLFCDLYFLYSYDVCIQNMNLAEILKMHDKTWHVAPPA